MHKKLKKLALYFILAISPIAALANASTENGVLMVAPGYTSGNVCGKPHTFDPNSNSTAPMTGNCTVVMQKNGTTILNFVARYEQGSYDIYNCTGAGSLCSQVVGYRSYVDLPAIN